MSDEAPTDGTVKTKGRPRPAETQARDTQVLEYLESAKNEEGAYVGKSREEIAGALDLTGKQVYLSLYRLSRENKDGVKMIVKGAAGTAHTWSPNPDAPKAEAVAE
jgi:hypothetical protein